jgi:hypothetical protein
MSFGEPDPDREENRGAAVAADYISFQDVTT